jgi:hypothetical protein
MNMNKILLVATLLVSVNAFAGATLVKNSYMNRAKEEIVRLCKAGAANARSLWAKVPAVPAPVKAKVTALKTWTLQKGSVAGQWIQQHTPAKIQQFVSDKRNLKIAGAATAVIASFTVAWRLLCNKLATRTTTATTPTAQPSAS